jgi:ribosomal protein S18 acetylase RimI-like enzyme
MLRAGEGSVQVVRLSWEDGPEPFRQAALLHMAEIHHGALPLLGARVLARLYRELARAPGCGVWAARDERGVRAFVAGCVDLRFGYRAVFRRAGLALGVRALPRLLSWRLLRRMPTLILYPFRRGGAADPPAEGAELLAIAVASAYQGRGLGRTLVSRLEDFFRAQGNVVAYRVATNAADPASNAFYRRLDFEVVGVRPHNNLQLRHYRKCLPARPMPLAS